MLFVWSAIDVETKGELLAVYASYQRSSTEHDMVHEKGPRDVYQQTEDPRRWRTMVSVGPGQAWSTMGARDVGEEERHRTIVQDGQEEDEGVLQQHQRGETHWQTSPSSSTYS